MKYFIISLQLAFYKSFFFKKNNIKDILHCSRNKN